MISCLIFVQIVKVFFVYFNLFFMGNDVDHFWSLKRAYIFDAKLTSTSYKLKKKNTANMILGIHAKTFGELFLILTN